MQTYTSIWGGKEVYGTSRSDVRAGQVPTRPRLIKVLVVSTAPRALAKYVPSDH